MWLLSTTGFYSVVRKPGESDLTVRARSRADLDALRSRYLPDLGPTSDDEGTDYPFRARVPAEALADAMGKIVRDIDYANFKDAVAQRQGSARAHVYGKVWTALRGIAPDITRRPELNEAYGGVVVDHAGRILLREPRGHFGGATWTFPKGNRNEGETAKDAAMREVEEEAGMRAEIIGVIPGEFVGTTSVTSYFLMRLVEDGLPLDAETERIKWVHPDEAPDFLSMSSAEVRARDHAVLEAARPLIAELRPDD